MHITEINTTVLNCYSYESFIWKEWQPMKKKTTYHSESKLYYLAFLFRTCEKFVKFLMKFGQNIVNSINPGYSHVQNFDCPVYYC